MVCGGGRRVRLKALSWADGPGTRFCERNNPTLPTISAISGLGFLAKP